MVKKEIVLDHKILGDGIQVNQAMIEGIDKLHPPIFIKGVRTFLGHVGFLLTLYKSFF